MSFLIDEVTLTNVSGDFTDVEAGLLFNGNIGSLEMEANEFDLVKQRILLDEVYLKNTTWSFEQHKPSVEDTLNSTPSNWLITANNFALENTKGHYIHVPNRLYLYPNISYFLAEEVRADIAALDFSVKTLEFNESTLNYYSGTAQVDTNLTSSTPLKWHVLANQITFSNNHLVYLDSTQTPSPNNQFNPSDLDIKNLSLHLSNLDITPKSLDAQLNQFAFHTSEGFTLKSFKGQLHLDDTHLELANHQLETSHSIIDYTIKASFVNLDQLIHQPELTQVSVAQLNGTIGRADVDYFYLLEEVPRSIQHLTFSVNLKGRLDKLDVTTFKLESKEQLLIDIDGKINGLPVINHLSYDLNINKLMTNLPAIRSSLQKQVTNSVKLPSWIAFQGSLKGTSTLVNAQLNMNSQLGQATVKAYVDILENNETFDINISAQELAVGRLTGQGNILGNATFHFTTKGRYFDPEKMDAQTTLELKKIKIGGHILQDGSLNATWKNQQLLSQINIKEEYLDFSINTTGQWINKTLTTSNNLNIHTIDFQKLNLSDESILLKSKLKIQTTGISLDDLKATASIEKGNLIHASGHYSFAPSNLTMLLKEASSSIKLESPIADINFESSFNIQEMPDVLKHQFSHYFDVTDEVDSNEHIGKTFTFSIDILNERIFEEVLIPGLEDIKINTIKGGYTSATHNLKLDADILHLKYNDIILDSLKLDITSNINTLSSKLTISQLTASGYTFHYPSIHAVASDNQLTVAIKLANEEKVQKFGIEGILAKKEEGYSWHTLEDGLMFYYEQWKVSPQNEIMYLNDKNIQIQDFKISNGKQNIVAKTIAEGNTLIDFNNFTVENLSAIVFSDDELISGLINGTITLGMQPTGFDFTSDIHIQHFAYGSDTLGDINLQITNPEEGNYKSIVKISGNNEINGSMNYKTTTDEVNGKLNLNQLNLTTIEKYVGSSITNLKGEAKGYVEVSGKLDNPNFKGQLNINNTSFHLNAINNTYIVEKSKLNFSQSELLLETLQLKDTKGNKASVNGSVSLENFFPNKLKIDVSTKDFPILNTKASKDELYYGNVSMTSKIAIRGTYDLPEVEAKVALTPGSDFTFIVPEDEVLTEDYKDVVEFVDFSAPVKPAEKEDIQTSKSEILGVQLNAHVEVNPDVTLRLIIDPIAGDYLEIKGNAYLNYELAPDGEMKLTGLYTVKEGHYQMTYYNIIKRKFSIEEGSTVTWSGDPYNARVNINAKYSTKASPLPLVQSQVSKTEVNSFRQSIPVDVVLTISNEMLSPNLDFNIVLPTYSSAGFSGIVKAKLNQLRDSESEMNKQVFSLLILNRFIPEDPNQNTASSSLGSSARGSVSQLVSDQFNALAGNYIKAVNVNFNFDSYTDYSSGQAQSRTDLEVELSKAIFNDRLIVSVGSDFNVEGNKEEENVNGFVGDVKAEYLLSEGGKYRVKVYRENEYAGAIDGNLTKTGFSFILTEEFKTLFKKKEEKEKKSSEEENEKQ